MKTIFLFLLSALSTHAQTILFSWDTPTNEPFPVSGYVFYVGQSPGAYSYVFSAGNGNSFSMPDIFPTGANYGVISDWGVDTNGTLWHSQWSNMTSWTNVPAVSVQQVLLTATSLWVGTNGNIHLHGNWTPWRTNSFTLPADGDGRFFMNGGISILRTNILVAPPLPPMVIPSAITVTN